MMPSQHSIESDSLSFKEVTILKARYVKTHPEFYRLQDVPWAIFGTLTWDAESKRKETHRSENLRKEDFKNLLFPVMKQFKIRERFFACYRALEYGQGECHYHFLIAEYGLERISTEDLAKTLEQNWINLLFHGRAEVGPYDQLKESKGVQYCLKKEYDQFGKERDRIHWFSGGLYRLLEKIQLNESLQHCLPSNEGELVCGVDW